MPRGAYLAAVATGSGSAGRDALQALAERMAERPDWQAIQAPSLWRIWVHSDAPLSVRVRADGSALIGETFPFEPTTDVDAALRAGPSALAVVDAARRISRAVWGRYVALVVGRQGPGVYRDPSGHLDALLWRAAPGVQVVASELARVPSGLGPARLALDWDRIAEFLARPAAVTTASLFDGLEAVGPGDLRLLGAAGPSVPVWTPAAFVDPAVEGRDAAAALVRRVDDCTAALVGRHARVLFELSGGLDSSILAGALGQLQLTSRVAQWLNWVGDRAEADETVYAAAVGARLGVQVTHVRKVPEPLSEEDLAELGSSLWPAMSGIDSARDRDEVERLAATGATAIVSGQGGDAVFFQMRSALVIADAVRREGLKGLASLLPNVARRTQLSVWAVLQRVCAAGRGVADEAVEPLLVSRELRDAARTVSHAWVRDAAARDVPPAKRLQIQTIANCHVYHGQSRRRAQADLLYPLLAQPVVELCLAIPAHHLAGGAHDRTYARTVFQDRLPDIVRRRRAKGAFNAYFGRLVGRSADVLRPYLIDGCLAEAGLLDRVALSEALDPDQLIRAGRPSEVLWAASVESWVRHWQTRLPDSASAPRPRP